MPSTPRTRRSRRALALVSAATAAGSLAAAPAALATPDEIVPRGAGLTAPTAVVQTPDGARWVADEVFGVCRVDGGEKALLEDLYCSDGEADAPHDGPINSMGLVFDAETSNFYTGDGQSNFGSIWRLHWDEETGRIDSATRLVSLGDDRATGVALAPGAYGASASVLYTTKRSTAVMKIEDAAGRAANPVPVGFAQQESPNGITVLDGAVYLAEGSSVTRIGLSGGARTAATVAGT
jgi:streptogramin lyase